MSKKPCNLKCEANIKVQREHGPGQCLPAMFLAAPQSLPRAHSEMTHVRVKHKD